MDGKPISQMLQDDLEELIKKYEMSGIEISQVIGTLSFFLFNLKADLREQQKRIKS